MWDGLTIAQALRGVICAVRSIGALRDMKESPPQTVDGLAEIMLQEQIGA